jgi:hypothetical protein
MAIRDKMRDQAAEYLQPGEQIQSVFFAIATSPYWSLLSYWIIIARDSNRIVVATDRRILVLKSSRWRVKARSLMRELPRNTVIGPPHGLQYKCETLGEPHLYIHKRFHKDIEAADAGARTGAA